MKIPKKFHNNEEQKEEEKKKKHWETSVIFAITDAQTKADPAKVEQSVEKNTGRDVALYSAAAPDSKYMFGPYQGGLSVCSFSLFLSRILQL